MNSIFSIWTTEGLLCDKNRDGVADGVSAFIDLPEGLAPIGLIDFCARLGFETTALSLDFFEQKENAVKISFVYSESNTLLKLENQNLIFLYKDEPELSSFLKLLAAMKPGINEGSSSLELREGRLFAGQKEIPVLSDFRQGETETSPKITSLSHLWNFSGLGKSNEASPVKLLDLNIGIEESLQTSALLREACYFVARMAMNSTKISFPLTGKPSAVIQFDITEGTETAFELVKGNHLVLKGQKDVLPQALHHLARAKHWSEEGAFGYWEQEYKLSQKAEEPLLFELEWTDESEVQLAFEKLKELKNLDDADIELFLSEPLDIRKKIESEWKAEFPAIRSLSVRSSFKPGLHWINEEIVPQLLSKKVKRIEIKVQAEKGANGLELPIRWIQEMYPVDRCIEEAIGLDANLISFHLEEDLPHTYEVYGFDEQDKPMLLGYLDVPVSKMTYLDGERFVYPVSSAVRIRRNVNLTEEHLILTDRERFYRFYVNDVLPKLWQTVSDYRSGQGHIRPFFDRLEIDVWMSEEERKLFVDEERISSLEALHEDLYFNTLDYFAYRGEEIEGKPFNAPGGVHPFMHIRTGEKPAARIQVFSWEDEPQENWITKAIHFDEDGSLSQAVMNNEIKELALSIHKFEKPAHHIHLDVEEWLQGQSRYQVVYPDHSYRGHAIPVIECYMDSGEEFYSPLKLSVFKKTIFLEAGHHSNEVSSTPAILQFLSRAEDMLKDWLKDVNVVILPLANPDGYELLTKLTKEHPEWKHHAARYNAVGLEYSTVRFHDTVFGEANIYPEILRRWAPDVIVDDHGIPSHEWVQPFAGYNSPPRFPVSYFLPSAKIYGIGRLSTGAYRPKHEANLETIVDHVSRFIQDTFIESENKYWQKRFIKYGNQWLPDVFPIEEAPGIHFYRMADVTPSYSTIGITRYPEWIAAEVISEANDEVVYGEVLSGCVEAHIVFDLAILDTLARADIKVKQNGDQGLEYQRIRPLQLQNVKG
ncbi:M14 family metallopeptidase [Cytobacillus dafuensis]|uniref:Peptidase M14 domain-containing protein n=1 Tax=Cytobacillus dafuensis TaxID=1742359 RepID=A0A5B8Z0C1_CYTDA|nr:M14 family metallopeptidase [Cytobacillus dafuensis]QED46328.1 hypothetical protein FSZ17_02985 [Cytobacillus dafuensis]